MRIAKKRRIPAHDNKSRLDFGDFSRGINAKINETLLPFRFAKRTYNFKVTDGALNGCTGVQKMNLTLPGIMNALPSKPEAVWHYRRYDFKDDYTDDHIMVYCQDRNIYYARMNSFDKDFILLADSKFVNIPSAINYRLNGDDVIIFSAVDEGMLIWDGVNPVKRITGAPPIASMAIHYERLFATVDGARNAVWFSDDLDPSNWNISSTEAGFIEMVDERGGLVKVVSFLDYLYVFREFGITRITAYGDQSQFSVTQLYTGSGKIYENTITVCGDRIYFLATDGMYMFDGLNAHKIFKQFDGIWGYNNFAMGGFHNGKFYLACNINYDDGLKVNGVGTGYINNTILEYDIANNEINVIRGIDVLWFCSCKSNYMNQFIFLVTDSTYRNFVCEFNESGNFIGKPLDKCWRSGMNDFGKPDKIKIIKSVSFLSEYDASLTIKTDTDTRTIDIKGSDKIQRLKINISGRRISFEFNTSTDKACISNPVFEVITR